MRSSGPTRVYQYGLEKILFACQWVCRNLKRMIGIHDISYASLIWQSHALPWNQPPGTENWSNVNCRSLLFFVLNLNWGALGYLGQLITWIALRILLNRDRCILVDPLFHNHIVRTTSIFFFRSEIKIESERVSACIKRCVFRMFYKCTPLRDTGLNPGNSPSSAVVAHLYHAHHKCLL